MNTFIRILVSLLLVACNFITISHALGTMAIDLGNEFIKVAIVKSGIPMEIALNKESKRKTPSIVSIRGNERFFGSSAESISIKYPANAYLFIPSLIGKTLEDPSVELFLRRFPFYQLSFEEQLIFRHNNETVFSVEQLMAMLLQNAKDIAESYAGETIKSAVITVPSFYRQAERRALLRAAQLANLDVHQLINQDTAVALHFGVFRSNSFNASRQLYMFFNMGSQSSSATVVGYELNAQDRTPQLTILGLGTDQTLGITEFALRMRDHLAKEFKREHKLDVFNDHRAAMKLLKEARRVVTILSANADTIAQVEFLMAEKDLRVRVTRQEFENLCGDLFSRIRPVFDQALMSAQVPLSDIKEVILMGGGTRVPKVQEHLLAASGKSELGRSINSDEAAAMGAVYQAAFHSPGFRVKEFQVKDFNYHSYKAYYEGMEAPLALYSRGNPYPQKRGLSISKHDSDMDVYVNYDESEKPANFTAIHLRNVSHAIGSLVSNGSRMKGFKLHFNMDNSGLLSLLRIDARLEQNAHLANANKSTLESLGDTISGLFAGSAGGDSSEEENVDSNSTTATAANTTTTTAPPVTSTPSNEIISVPIDFSVEYLDAEIPSEEVMEKSRKMLQDMRELELEILALEKSRNELESFIFNTRDRLEMEPFVHFSAVEDRQAIEKALQLASDWYEEQGADTSKLEYDSQLESIRQLIEPVEVRMKEHKERPAHFDQLSSTLDMANEFHRMVQQMIQQPVAQHFFANLTADFGVFPFDRHMENLNEIIREKASKMFTEEELKTFKELIDQQRVWHNESKQLTDKLPKHQDSVVKVSEIQDKTGNIVRQVTSLQEKYDTNRRLLRLEIQKWIRAKRNELREEADANKQNDTIATNGTQRADETKSQEPAEKEEEKDPAAKKEEEPATTTSRSDL